MIYRSYAIDYSDKCTSIIDLILSTIIIEMKTDGTFDSLYNKELGVYWDQSCTAPGSSSSTSALDLTDLVSVARYAPAHPQPQ